MRRKNVKQFQYFIGRKYFRRDFFLLKNNLIVTKIIFLNKIVTKITFIKIYKSHNNAIFIFQVEF